MSPSAPVTNYVSIEEYLAVEALSEAKHEYYNGEVFAMARASVPHNRLVRNGLSAVDGFLRGKLCEVFPSDLKTHVKTKSAFVYPDLSIVCNGLQFYKSTNDIIVNPTVIIEVLSPDTERYDRGKKFILYRQIESLQEYILISSMEILVEKFTRDAADKWILNDHKGLPDKLLIGAINLQLPLAEIYRDVAFESEN